MMMRAMRVQVSLRLTEESRRGWDRAALRGGVTLTALIEAIGLTLDVQGRCDVDEAIGLARRIDLERRNRR